MSTKDPRAALLASRYTAASPTGWKSCTTHRETFRDFCPGCAAEVGFALARDAGDRFDEDQEPDAPRACPECDAVCSKGTPPGADERVQAHAASGGRPEPSYRCTRCGRWWSFGETSPAPRPTRIR